MTQRRNRNQQTPQSTKKRAIIGVISLILIALLYVQLTSPEMLRSAPEFPSFDYDTKAVSGTSNDIRASYSNDALLFESAGDTTASSDSEPSSDSGTSPLIAIYTNPGEATVFINKEYAGDTITGKWFVYKVELDTDYEVKIIKDGYNTITETIVVTEDSDDLIEQRTFTLSSSTTTSDTPASDEEPSTSPSTVSSSSPTSVPITVTVNTPADIYIDGTKIKTSSKEYKGLLAPGEYHFEATASGYEGELITKTLTKDPVTVTFNLKSTTTASSPEQTSTPTITTTPTLNIPDTAAKFKVTTIAWSEQNSNSKYNYLSVVEGSTIDIWAKLTVETQGIIKPGSFGVIIKKDVSLGDDNYNPSTKSFFDLNGYESTDEIRRSMIKYSGPEKTVTSGQTLYIKVGSFKTESGTSTVNSDGAREYYGKGYIDPSITESWQKTYDPTSSGTRHRVTTYRAYTSTPTDTTTETHKKASFEIDHVAFSKEGGTKYSRISNAVIGEKIYMYAYLTPSSPGYVDKYDFALKSKKDFNWYADHRYNYPYNEWVRETTEDFKSGLQKYTGESFYLSAGKYVQVGYFYPDESTADGSPREYYAKGFKFNGHTYENSYNPTNDGVRNRVYVP